VRSIDDGSSGKQNYLCVFGLIDSFIDHHFDFALVDYASNEVVCLIDDDYRVIELILFFWRKEAIDIYLTDTVIVNEGEPLVDDVCHLFGDAFSDIGRLIFEIWWSVWDGDKVFHVSIEKLLGDAEAFGVIDVCVLANLFDFPMLFLLVEWVTAFAELTFEVVLEAGGEHDEDLVGGHEGFSDGDSRTCFA
jgi:hypothetical protein